MRFENKFEIISPSNEDEYLILSYLLLPDNLSTIFTSFKDQVLLEISAFFAVIIFMLSLAAIVWVIVISSMLFLLNFLAWIIFYEPSISSLIQRPFSFTTARYSFSDENLFFKFK